VEIIDIENSISGVFDGIWACASLVHMNEEQICQVLLSLKANLNDEGIIYVSLKYGDGVLENNNQIYYLYNENYLTRLHQVGYEVLNHKVSINDNPVNSWIEFILQKK
ncbi:MAG: hypothetical protein ACK5NF_05925, partial [Bacilli bacterium]